MLLRWGRDVAQFQGLPLFEISFSCVLGTSSIVTFSIITCVKESNVVG